MRRAESGPKIWEGWPISSSQLRPGPSPHVLGSTPAELPCVVWEPGQVGVAGTIGHVGGGGDMQWKIKVEKHLFWIWVVHHWERHKFGEDSSGMAEEHRHYLKHGKTVTHAGARRKEFQSRRREGERECTGSGEKGSHQMGAMHIWRTLETSARRAQEE